MRLLIILGAAAAGLTWSNAVAQPESALKMLEEDRACLGIEQAIDAKTLNASRDEMIKLICQVSSYGAKNCTAALGKLYVQFDQTFALPSDHRDEKFQIVCR